MATMWWHRSRSTLAQVMACCLTTPSHYLNQYRLIISDWGIHLWVISWQMLKISIFDMCLKITNFRLQPHLPGANVLNIQETLLYIYGSWNWSYMLPAGTGLGSALSFLYRKSHLGKKTVIRLSYLHSRNSCTGKVSFLYGISPRW